MVQPEHKQSAVETLRAMREQVATYDPIDKLLQLQRDLLALVQVGLNKPMVFIR